MSKPARRVVLPLLVFAVMAGLWQAASSAFHVPAYLLPSPAAIFRAAARLGWALPGNGLATLVTVLAGFGLSLLVGVPLGILVSASPWIADAVYPLLIFAHAVPVVAIAPVVVVTLGTNLASRLVIVVLIAFFPVMVSTARGLLNTPKPLLELAEATGASRFVTIRTIRLPYAAPFLFSGMRIAATVSVVGAVVSEFVASDRGLGYLIVAATSRFDVPQAMAAVLVLAVGSILFYQAVGLAERVLVPWSGRNGDDL